MAGACGGRSLEWPEPGGGYSLWVVKAWGGRSLWVAGACGGWSLRWLEPGAAGACGWLEPGVAGAWGGGACDDVPAMAVPRWSSIGAGGCGAVVRPQASAGCEC